MKLFSNPSAPEKPDLDETASELEKTVSGPSNEIPKDTPPWEIRNADFQTIEVVTIEDERTRKHEWSFVEFCPQFVAILPGLIILFACGMQLSWGIIEYDLSLWRQMNGISYACGALVVLCWYGGAIVGNLFGALLVIHIGKKFIYLLASFLLILSADFLMNSYISTYHIVGRTLLGFTYSIAQLAVISYASEATTKKIRVVLLGIIGYINALSVLFASSIANGVTDFQRYYFYEDDDTRASDEQDKDYYGDVEDRENDDENMLVSYSAMVIMALAVVVLISAPFLARESIPYMIRKTKHKAAFKEFVLLRSKESSMPNVRHDFDLWKGCIMITPKPNLAIFKRENRDSLRLTCSTRLLSLFFNSIVLMAIFVRITDVDSRVEEDFGTNTAGPRYDEQAAIQLFVGFKTIQIIMGLVLLVISLKWNVDRFCFKMSFAGGMSVCFLYVVYSCVGYFIKIPDNILLLVVLVVVSVFLLLPMRMEIYQYSQIAEAFVEDNSRKIWTIAFVNCIEHMVHIFLLLQIFMFFSYAILLTGFGMLYISFWLIKNMPNIGAVHPLERSEAIPDRWNHLKYIQSNSMHI